MHKNLSFWRRGGVILAALLAAAPAPSRADAVLFVTAGDYVGRYDIDAAAFNPVFINLLQSTGIALDTSRHLYVATTGGLPNSGAGVMEYNSVTGAQIGTDPFVNYYGTPGGDPRDVIGPSGMRFGASGNLAIADTLLSNVHIYNSLGVSQGNITGPSLSQPTDVTFDAAGNLYAAGGGGIFVSTGGAPFADFIEPASNPSLVNPVALTVGSDGKFYVADNSTDKVLRFNADGTFDSVYIDLDEAVDGAFQPTSIIFGNCDDLYIAGLNILGGSGEVLFFKGNVYQGVILGDLGNSVGFLAFVPEPATWLLPLGLFAAIFGLRVRKFALARSASATVG